MTGVDRLWFLADEARRAAERVFYRLDSRYDDYLSWDRHRSVSRRRFRTLARRVSESGTPFGAHTVVYREDGALLLVRHAGVDQWVVPGGGVDEGDDSLLATARRELDEEAGVDATYEGLAVANRVRLDCRGHETWGVLPLFAARADGETPTVDDPDGEIVAADWFHDLPDDTRDRGDLVAWREARGLQ